jgi:hypothetical protein
MGEFVGVGDLQEGEFGGVEADELQAHGQT